MRMLAGIVAVALLAPAAASSEPGRRPPPNAVVVVPETEGMGCYWYRQRQYCGRYCYREVDGRRYCRERAREAYPQGILDLGWWRPMK